MKFKRFIGIITLICLASFIGLTGCAQQKEFTDQKGHAELYHPCGLFDQDDCKDPNIK